MGGNGVTQSAFFNPALAALPIDAGLQCYYSNRYGLEELGTLTGSFHYPNPVLPLAVHLSSFGYDAYRETMLHLAVGKRLNRQWLLGAAIHYALLQTELFDERPARLAADLGLLFFPSNKLRLGLAVTNAPSVPLGDKATGIRSMTGYGLQAGFQWAIIEQVTLAGCLRNAKDVPLSGSAGMEYTAFRCFYLRVGIQTHPLLPAFGVGFDLDAFTLDVAAVSHSVLGISTSIGISYHF
jgi:hypothetical protein